MQLRRWIATILAGLAPAGIVSPTAAGPPVEERDARYLFRYFSDSDDVRVFSHYGNVQMELRDGRTFFLQWNHEDVVVPGVQAPAGSPDAVDAITSASRPIADAADAFRDYHKRRNEIKASVEDARAELGYYVSTEADYFAQQLRGRYNVDAHDGMLNLAAGASYGWDRITPLNDEDTRGTKDRKTTWHGDLVLTRVVSPTTVVRLGAEASRVRGLQHNPYRNVYAGGAPVPELHPDARWRRDLFLRVSRYLRNRSSLKADYRLYTDDWGVQSHTVGLRLTQYVTEDAIFRYRYRYYSQGAAWFYAPEYEIASGIDGYLTGDYRLERFDAHLFGVQVRLNLAAVPAARGVLDGTALRVKYERYFNSNNFSANIFESSLTYQF